ncbi:phosphotransacetylase family protein [Methanolobus psychrotolerans]|uniref:phosphotransacetylase family protein n=1 Tax=Methanolobus psychrotolerans TaxID=1874706 RepID=UPI000B91CF05|nr:phosphotransacetylase family protein [Methanolobus psychrotolerans]
MASILISSSEEFSGKSSICMGLGKIFQASGLKVGYMKPVGNLLIDVHGSLTDEDSEGIRKLLGIDDPAKYITPIHLTDSLIDDALKGVEKDLDERLTEAYSIISKDKDIVFIEGTGGIGGGSMYGLSDPEITSKLGTKILLVTRFDSISAVDRILCDIRIIGNNDMLTGLILNEVPISMMDRVSELVVPFLEKKGIKVFGIIPEDDTLRSVFISEIVEDLRAEVLVSPDKLDQLVEHYLVGAMEVGSAIKYFRRQPNSAVITGGDRADIQMAAIDSRVKCLILTGNMRPSGAVLASAEEAEIPVILVRGDTMNTIERMEHLIGHANIKQQVKLDRVIELIKNHLDIPSIAENIGVKLKS